MSINSLPYLQSAELKGHKGGVLVSKFNTDGSYALSGGQDRIVRLWNPHKGSLVMEYSGAHGYEIADIAVSCDNARFASVGADKPIFLWDVATANVVRRIRGHDGRINAVQFNAEASVIISASYDQTVKCWDNRSASRDPVQVLSDFKDSVTSLCVLPHSIVAGSVDGRVRTFDLRNGRLVTDHIMQSITSVAISHDQNCMLVSCLDGRLRLFDRSCGELLKEYTGHMNTRYRINSVFSTDDAYVISGSEDQQIYFWDLVDGKVAHKLSGHTGPVTCVDYHPTEVCLLSSATDGVIKVWKNA